MARETIYIDGKRCVMGRLASFAAKEALEGKDVIIVNSEEVVLTGSKPYVIGNYKKRMKKIGYRHKGPFWPRRPDDILRRAIKRMLPYKKARGSKAFKGIKTYIGIPEKFAEVNFKKFPKAKLHEDEIKFVKLKDLSKEIGGLNE